MGYKGRCEVIHSRKGRATRMSRNWLLFPGAFSWTPLSLSFPRGCRNGFFTFHLFSHWPSFGRLWRKNKDEETHAAVQAHLWVCRQPFLWTLFSAHGSLWQSTVPTQVWKIENSRRPGTRPAGFGVDTLVHWLPVGITLRKLLLCIAKPFLTWSFPGRKVVLPSCCSLSPWISHSWWEFGIKIHQVVRLFTVSDSTSTVIILRTEKWSQWTLSSDILCSGIDHKNWESPILICQMCRVAPRTQHSARSFLERAALNLLIPHLHRPYFHLLLF